MEDTPQPIKDLQLKIWLSKPPMERLRQFLIDNTDYFKLINHLKKSISESRKDRNLSDKNLMADKSNQQQ